MSLTTLLLISMGVFAFLRYIAVPRLETKLEMAVTANDRLRLVKSAGSLAAADKLKELALGACIGFGLLALLVAALTLLHANSLESVKRTIDAADRVHATLKALSDRIGIWTYLLAFGGMAALWYRAGKRGIVRSVEDRVNAQVIRLAAEAQENPSAWEELAPTDQMRAVWLSLQSVLRQIEVLDTGDPQGEEKRKALEIEVERRYRVYHMLDVQRRIAPAAIFARPAEAGGFWRRASRIVLNKGVFSDLKGVSNLLSYGVNALFCILLAGFGSGAAAGALAARTVQLQDLQVKLSLKESAQAREKATQKQAAQENQQSNPPSPSASSEDQLAARALARAMAVRSGHSTVSQAGHTRYAEDGEVRATDFESRARGANQAAADLLRASVEARTAPRDAAEGSAPGNEGAGSATEAEEKSAIDFADSALSRKPSAAEKFFIARIEKQQRSSPRFRAAVLKWWHSHSEPLEFTDLASWSVTETMGRAAGLAGGEDSGLKLVTEVLTSTVSKSASTALDIDGNLFFAQFAETADIEKALQAIDAPSRPYRSVDSILIRVLDANLPDGSAVSNAATALRQSARRASVRPIPEDIVDDFKALPSEIVKGREVALAELATDFDSEYPRGDTATVRDKVMAALSGRDTNGIEARRMRATDFGSLKAYSRVGGILFGRAVPPDPPLDFTDLSWQTADGGVTLLLRRRDGKLFSLGPFPPTLIYQALGYVADQRLTVVTLLNAALIDRRQVMLHPAFADTPLGCRIIRDDQWIFHYADPAGTRGHPTKLREQLNAVEWDMNLYKQGLNLFKHPEQVDLPDTMPHFAPSADSPFHSEETRRLFNAGLTGAVEHCRSEKTGNAFANCIRRVAGGNEWVSQLADNAPKTGFVSQIRESDYRLDPDLAFLQAPPNARSIWPLEWTVQMTIDDNATWTFSAFDKDAEGSVLEGLSQDKRLDELRELRQLCLLQRFARVAFSGKFGASFPMTKLPALAEATRPGQKNRLETPRWVQEPGSADAKPGRYFRSYQPPAPAAFPAAKSLFAACADALDARLSASAVKKVCSWPDLAQSSARACKARLDTGKSFESVDACQVFSRTAQADIVTAVLAIQDKLAATEAVNEESIRCPAPAHGPTDGI